MDTRDLQGDLEVREPKWRQILRQRFCWQRSKETSDVKLPVEKTAFCKAT